MNDASGNAVALRVEKSAQQEVDSKEGPAIYAKHQADSVPSDKPFLKVLNLKPEEKKAAKSVELMIAADQMKSVRTALEAYDSKVKCTIPTMAPWRGLRPADKNVHRDERWVCMREQWYIDQTTEL